MRMLWLTRPQADSEIMATALNVMGVATLVAPLLEIEHCAVTLPELPPDAVLLTSRHAAFALPNDWSHRPVYCVGGATADAARARGFMNVISGDGDILSLLPRMAESLQHKTLIYFSGEDISMDVGALLSTQQVHVERLIAYRAVAIAQLPSDVVDALQKNTLSGVVFFSSRTARIAHQLLQMAGLGDATTTMDAYCLSLPIAQIAGGLPWRRIHVAHVPTMEAMQAMIHQHYLPN